MGELSADKVHKLPDEVNCALVTIPFFLYTLDIAILILICGL